MALLLQNFLALLVLGLYVRYSAGQTKQMIANSNTAAPLTTCEPITSDIPTCLNVGWTNASYPNLRLHESQKEAFEELDDFNPLIDAECSNKIVHFLCGVYAPFCTYRNNTQEGFVVLSPCRSLCEHVRNGCEPLLESEGYSWPEHLNCANFPNATVCLDVPDDVEIPTTSRPMTTSATNATGAFPTTTSTPVCDGFIDEGECVESCNSQKYIVDSNQTIVPNPDYRVTFYNQCLRSCPEEYVEFMSRCNTSCPEGFVNVDGICEECIGECDIVSPAGQVIVAPQEQTVNRLDNATFTCSSPAGPGNMYFWLYNFSSSLCDGNCTGSNITAILANISQYSISSQQLLVLSFIEAPTHAGTYHCIVVNDAGFGTDLGALFMPPEFVVNPENTLTTSGSNVTLSCLAESFPYPSYQWQKLNVAKNVFEDITGETGTDLILSPVSFNDYGQYQCMASNVINNITVTAESTPATVTVSPEGLVSVFPDNFTAVQNGNVQFHCRTTVGPDDRNKYMWLTNAGNYLCYSSGCSHQQNYQNLTSLLYAVHTGYLNITVSTSPYLNIMDISATEHGGVYDCIVSNDAGTGSASASLYVEPYITLHPVDVFAVSGEIANFTCMAESFPYPSYQWQKLQGSLYIDIVNETDTTLSIEVGHNSYGVYRCVAMSLILGNTIFVNSNEATLHVSPEGLVSVFPDNMTAIPETDVQLHCTTTAGPDDRNTYLWLRNASNYLCSSSECSQQQIYPNLTSLLYAIHIGSLNINISTKPYLNIMDISAREHGAEYVCIVSNDAGSGKASAILYVEPYITLHPVDMFAFYGEVSIFTCMAESFPYPSYQWQKLQGSMYIDIMNETDNILSIDIGNNSYGVYRCVAMSLILGNTLSVSSNEAILHVSPEGLVSIFPKNFIAIRNDNVQLHCNTAAGPDDRNTYMWLRNTSNYLCSSSECSQQQTYTNLTSLLHAVDVGLLNIRVSTTSYLYIMGINVKDDGAEYDCIVSNDAGIGRASVTLYVEPYITLHPVDAVATYGETATFTCMAESFPSPSYQWQKWQGSMYVDILNETSTILAIDTGENSVGVYRCVAMSLILGNIISVSSNEATLHGLAAFPPNSFEIIGPFIAWVAPIMYIGNILRYEVRVTSATGDAQIISKNGTEFYHILAREDMPTNLGGSTSVIVQMRVVTSDSVSEWSSEKSVPVTVLVISDLIPTLTDPKPEISFINNSPIVSGRNVIVHLSVNHPYSLLECRLSASNHVQLGEKGKFHDCSSGMITYTDLRDAKYTFYALARLLDGRQLITNRNFRPDNMVECSVHLINNGIMVTGNSAVIEFAFFGDYTRCKLDQGNFEDCSSPYVLTNLSPGTHFLKIVPQVCIKAFRHPLSLYFDIE